MNRQLSYVFLVSIISIVSCGEQQTGENIDNHQQLNPSKAEHQVAKLDSNGDLDRGRKLYIQCRACHSLHQGDSHKIGPNLYGIFNSKAGTREGFNYSDEFTSSIIVWNVSTLNLWLEKPYELIPGNKMVFSGMSNEKDRRDLIAYLFQKTTD